MLGAEEIRGAMEEVIDRDRGHTLLAEWGISFEGLQQVAMVSTSNTILDVIPQAIEQMRGKVPQEVAEDAAIRAGLSTEFHLGFLTGVMLAKRHGLVEHEN